MFSYFHRNKCAYEKGQITPFFIVILVVIIIMAMVTVNLSKVAFTKGETANAVDAGALAAGSVMANLFNVITKVTKDMEKAYWGFFNKVSVDFVMAVTHLSQAYILSYIAQSNILDALKASCWNPCYIAGLVGSALALTEQAIPEIEDGFIPVVKQVIIPEVDKFHDEQFQLYQEIFRMVQGAAEKGLKQAKKMGLKFAFMNSGIGNKLKVSGGGKSRSDFEQFLNDIKGEKDTETFSWTDGQGRNHSVEVKINIDPVNAMGVKVTQIDYSQERSGLLQIVALAQGALMRLKQTEVYLQIAKALLDLACWLMRLGCLLCVILALILCSIAKVFVRLAGQTNLAARNRMDEIYAQIPEYWARLLPREEVFISKDEYDAADKIICWIDEVYYNDQPHNRLVRVDTLQQHEGSKEAGLWKYRYPDTKSFSVVSFEGYGQIYQARPKNNGVAGPIMRHTPSIIQTDKAD